MKHTIKILLSVGVLFANTLAFAYEVNEAIAPWERDADSKLWGERVLAGVFSGEKNRIGLNAFCDSRSFKEIRALREEARSSIRNDVEKGDITDSTHIWKTVLEIASRIDIVPASDLEKRLLCEVDYFKCGYSMPSSMLTDEKNNNDKLERSIAPSVIISRLKNRLTGKAVKVSSRVDADIRMNVNLSEYELGLCKVDYYKLYLYLWEDCPWIEVNCIKYLPMLTFLFSQDYSHLKHSHIYCNHINLINNLCVLASLREVCKIKHEVIG